MNGFKGIDLALDQIAKARLGEAIRQLRGDRSQRVFAEVLGVGQATIQAWESGTGGTPTLDNLEKIAKLRDELPEQFVAYLFGRNITVGRSLHEIILTMTCEEIADISYAIAMRLRRGEH